MSYTNTAIWNDLTISKYFTFHNGIEPINSVSPKLFAAEALNYVKAHNGANIGILCPASGFPVPVYKWVNKFLDKDYYLEKFFSSEAHLWPYSNETEN